MKKLNKENLKNFTKSHEFKDSFKKEVSKNQGEKTKKTDLKAKE
ncbi:hypothetical protein [Neobacillus sp. D3-1R]